MGYLRARARLTQKEEILAIKSAAAAAAIQEFDEANSDYLKVGALLSRKAANEIHILDKLKVPDSASGPYIEDGVWHLPKSNQNSAPMLKAALLNMFPVNAPDKPWLMQEISSFEDAHDKSKKERLLVTGVGLSQAELDVLLGAICMSNGALDQVVEISPNEFLKSIGRGVSAKSISNLFTQFTKLKAHDFYYESQINGRCETLSKDWKLIENLGKTVVAAKGFIPQRTTISFSISSEFIKFFKLGFGVSWTRVNLKVRRELDGNQKLALWLHAYLTAFPPYHFRPVEALHAISGSKTGQLRNFKADISLAARQLIAKGFLQKHWVDPKNGHMHFLRGAVTAGRVAKAIHQNTGSRSE